MGILVHLNIKNLLKKRYGRWDSCLQRSSLTISFRDIFQGLVKVKVK